jgi:hypothetical protein
MNKLIERNKSRGLRTKELDSTRGNISRALVVLILVSASALQAADFVLTGRGPHLIEEGNVRAALDDLVAQAGPR